MKLDITPRLLHFKQPAGTSRGIYTTRKSWMVTVTSPDTPGRQGVGECAPLPDLSCDAIPNYEAVLRRMCDLVEATGSIPYNELCDYPSMLFGLETALLNFERGSNVLFDTPFGRGEEGIPINGLVWMGSYDEMLARMEEKMALGFRCIKLKIGAIDFDNELDLIRRIRQRFTRDQIEIRVDANGAFLPSEALAKLRQLAQYDLHSIEQPIRQRQWSEMARLCQQYTLPIALDEELIGVNSTEEKIALLDTIRPAYIVLKPSLHGGMRGTREWVELARQRGIGSWITSALESNIGLNAIAHLTAHIYGSNITIPQGLGTGALFTDNIPMPLAIKGDALWCENDRELLYTSGSTGAPKPVWVERGRMEASANVTCDFLGLKPGDTALQCISSEYIGGKMMEVRAAVRGLNLTTIAPTGHPLASVGDDGFDFVAMVPMQVYNSLQVSVERERLMRIRHLIIGGGAIDESLESALRDFPNAIWSTYGMTETLSHIALRRVNGPEATSWYTPLCGVSFSIAPDGCLIINAPAICPEPVVTNDIVELSPDGSRFRVLGRKDNVIISGGIKIQIEEMEQTLRPHIPFPFMITKRPDEKFGEAVVMLMQNGDETIARNACRQHLSKYKIPRYFISVSQLPLTPSGKPARLQAAHLAQKDVS